MVTYQYINQECSYICVIKSSHRLESLEVVFKVTFLHEFQHYYDRVIDSHHSVQLYYVGMLELAQNGCLLEETHLVSICCLPVCMYVCVCVRGCVRGCVWV